MAKKNEIRFDKLPKENPFSVPEGYFEGFSERLSERLSSGEKSEPKKSRSTKIIRLVKNQLALAASLAAFAIISYFTIQFILKTNFSKNPELNFSELVEYNIEDYEMDLLMESYTENINSDENQDEYEQVIIEYLLAENIDLQMIIEEL